jgi:hypothetical protein
LVVLAKAKVTTPAAANMFAANKHDLFNVQATRLSADAAANATLQELSSNNWAKRSTSVDAAERGVPARFGRTAL